MLSVFVMRAKTKGEYIMNRSKNSKSYKPSPIPPFKTLDEEAEFWDTHDTSLLFKNPNTPLSKLPRIEKEKEDTLVLRLQKTVKAKLERNARAKGLSVSSFARMLLIERLATL